MAGNTAILAVRIIGDADGATKAYKTAETGADKFAAKMGKVNDGAKVAGLAAGAALTKGLFDAVDADTANRKMAAQLNLGAADAEAAGKLSGKLYGDAYGESVEQVNTAISAVGSTLAKMSDNGGADVERLTKKALDMAGTFDTDVTEAVGTAGILMKTGLAKNGDEAFDLLVGSMQKMPKAMQAELLPVMDEYSKHFAALGIDGNTAFGIMQQAAQDGAIGMDKMGDSLKELTIRATDGSKTTVDAYKAIGLNADDMTAKMLAGGDQAGEAFGKIVAGLQEIDDPAAQSAAALALFGTPLEDLGTDKIPEFLGAIDPAGDAFDSLAGSAEKMGEKINSGPGMALETFSRKALASLQEVAAGALPVLQPMIDVLIQFAPILGPAAVAVAALAAMVWLVNGAMVAWNAAVLVGKGAVAVATAAQWAWNAAMAANPIGVIILLVAALVAGIIWAYNNVGWFKDAVDAMGRFVGDVWNNLVAGIRIVIQWLNDMLAPVGGIEGALKILGTVGAGIWDGMTRGISGVIGWIKDAIGWFQKLFGAQDKANAGSSGPVGDASRMAAPMSLMSEPAPEQRMSIASFSPLAMTAPASSGSWAGISTGGRRASVQEIHNTYKIDVAATPGTDRVALGRELAAAIKTYERSTGKTGGSK